MRKNNKKLESVETIHIIVKTNKPENFTFFLDPLPSMSHLFSDNNLRFGEEEKKKTTNPLTTTFFQVSTFLLKEQHTYIQFSSSPAFLASTSPEALHLDIFSESELAEDPIPEESHKLLPLAYVLGRVPFLMVFSRNGREKMIHM